MKTRILRRGVLLSVLVLACGLLVVILSGPHHPMALLRVVDTSGKPIAGAVIQADGLRSKPGPYNSGHYGWRPDPHWPDNKPVTTDAEGYARVPYPKYVFERIETGQISFTVDHPEYVPDRPFRDVAATPPAGAPWRQWADFLAYRVRLKALIDPPEPVVLQLGATLKLTLGTNFAQPAPGRLFAQVSGLSTRDPSFWLQPAPGTLVTRRLGAGTQTLRAVYFGTNASVWFGNTLTVNAVPGQTNEVVADVQPGIAVHGQLDAAVPRPVVRGRVVAHVWPPGQSPRDNPPQWHAWTPVAADGTFALPALPAGELEIVALCQGFVSTNGPGEFTNSTHYPQKHLLGTKALNLVLGMSPTACLEVEVRDAQNRPLPNATVATWPNVRYGEWSATILAGDCYNSAELLQEPAKARSSSWWKEVPDFKATTDASGLAVLSNLPVEVKEFNVEHAGYALPAVATGMGEKRRQTSVSLSAGQTNRVVVRLEPRGQSAISHY